MTVDSQLKNSYYTIKQIEATLSQLQLKTDDTEAKHVFSTAEELIASVKEDLNKQLTFIAKEETEYE